MKRILVLAFALVSANAVFGQAGHRANAFPDIDHSVDEQRFVIIGSSDRGRILVVAYRRW